jgi:hypothetical protein
MLTDLVEKAGLAEIDKEIGSNEYSEIIDSGKAARLAFTVSRIFRRRNQILNNDFWASTTGGDLACSQIYVTPALRLLLT